MATELYDLTVPALERGLAALSGILAKAEAFADEQGLAHDVLLQARLIADMQTLVYQVQRVSDSAKGAVVRLGQAENPVMEDNEASFADLQARIARTVAFVQSVPRSAIDGREDADVVLKTPGGDIHFKGRDYALGFVLPNFYFHVTAAYAILRHKGVPLGKLDYLGRR